jgi:hypothetical protein
VHSTCGLYHRRDFQREWWGCSGWLDSLITA